MILYSLILAGICFIFFLSAHVIIFHKWPPKRRFRTLIYLVLVSILLYAVIFVTGVITGFSDMINTLISGRIMGILSGIFIYFFIYFFYFHLIIIFDRSVTPRIMVEIDQSAEKRLTIEEIKSRYRLEDKVRKEFVDMDLMGRIKKTDNYYYNTEKGLFHAKIMTCLREYLHIGGHQ